jgi:hypothetical protein
MNFRKDLDHWKATDWFSSVLPIPRTSLKGIRIGKTKLNKPILPISYLVHPRKP